MSKKDNDNIERNKKTKILIKQKWVFKRQLQESSFELCVDNDEAVFILFLFLIWHPTSRKENQFFQSSVIVKSNKHLFRNLFKALQHTSKTIQYHTLFIEVFYIWLRCKSAICRLNNDYVVCDAFDANRYRNL